MKRILLSYSLMVLLIACSMDLNAQSGTFYFMKGVPQAKDLNPAIQGLESGFYFSMPFISKLDISANTNNWSYKDLIHFGIGPEKDLLVWDFKNYISSLDKRNFIQESTSLTLLEFGWRKGSKFFSLSLSEKGSAELFFRKDLAEFIYNGNEPYMGTTFRTGNFGMSAQHYRQLAFTYSKSLNKKQKFGITGKLLFGMAAVRSKGINMASETLASGDGINLETNGTLFLSVPLDFQQIGDGYNFTTTNNFDAKKYLLQFGNPGFAVDLGFTSKISKKFELSLSIIDLGLLLWTNDLSTFSGKGSYFYHGINLNDPSLTGTPTKLLQPLVHTLRDEFISAFPPNKNSENFLTVLPVKLYAGGEYRLNRFFQVSGLARFGISNSLLHTSFTASVSTVLHKNLSLYTSYSMDESTWDNFGIGTAWKVGSFQFYAVTDNIFSPFHPESARNINLSAGINLIFLKKNRIEKRRTLYVPDIKTKYRRH
ncbi:MAG TPA: DUF5723 family protein [Prolixibacteraceae bacterium]